MPIEQRMSQGSSIERRLTLFSRFAAALSVAVCLLVLLGWVVDIPALKSLLPGFATMKANTAVAFGLSAASLWLLTMERHEPSQDIARTMARLAAAAVVLLSAVTLSEYFFGWQSGLDQWLVRDLAPGSLHPGRMSSATAASFIVLGTGLLLFDIQSPRGRWATQWLALAVAFNGFVAVLGYVYGVQSLYGVQPYSSMALHTALLFFLLGVALPCARPAVGMVARVIADDAGGFLIRRLLPAIILVPVAVGTLRLYGQLAGLYTSEFGVAIYTVVNIAILAVLVWWTAASVRRTDASRKRAQSKLQAQLGRLDLLQQITHAVGERQDLSSIFQVVLSRLETDLPVEFACVGLFDTTTRRFTINTIGAATAPLANDTLLTELTSIEIEHNGLARCLEGQLVYEPDISAIQLPLPRQLTRAGMRSLILAPLLSNSGVFGAIVVARRRAGAFSSNACEFLNQLGEHVGLAAHQAQLYESLQRAYDELRQSQDVILQQERLKALGQMASGVAHDINNAISPMALYTELLLQHESGLNERAREYLTTIQRATEDVAQTVSRLREFYRPREQQATFSALDLNSLVQQVIDLTRARWGDIAQSRGIDIQLLNEPAPDLPCLLGAENEIRDALTNLIFNAVDAMPEGGTLGVHTRAGDESWVEVEISDTGLGMSEETRRRCLEPFYTTKGERGTGMGLAMVFGMAQRHGAELQIESTVGAGTVMRLRFPAAGNTESTHHSAEPANAPARGLRLLTIDDDPLVIRSLCSTLESDGHIVITADGGQAGIDTFRDAHARGERFAAVITDLGMPVVDGRKVAAGIKAVSPATPVLLLTGWGQRLTAENDIPAHVDYVLNKPPRLQDLRAVLSSVAANEQTEPGVSN